MKYDTTSVTGDWRASDAYDLNEASRKPAGASGARSSRAVANRAVAKSATGFRLGRILTKQIAPLAVFVIMGLLLRHKIAELDIAHIRAALSTVGPVQWAMGLGLTAISFWSLGQYDVVVHRLVGRDTHPTRAARTGMTAIAIGQTVGMGALTGAFVRWRMLPGLGLMDATKISAIVSVSFLVAWAMVTAVVVLTFGAALPFATPLAVLVLLFGVALAVTSVWRPGALARLPLPPLKAMGLITAFSTIDVLAAAGALWVMMPETVEMSFALIFPAYLLALGAGLVMTTPGGVGPFEVAMIALMPAFSAEDLLAAILAYRAVYYAVPGLIGAALLIRPPSKPPLPLAAKASLEPVQPTNLSLMVEASLDRAPRAEAALLRHGRFELLSNERAWPTALVARSGQSLIMLGDPLSKERAGDEVFDGLRDRARATLRAPVIYKAGGRLAAQARRAGWPVLPVAREAWLDLKSFSLDTPARKNLRRKLRKAEKAGLEVTVIAPGDPHPLPLDDMALVARQWAEMRGGERGFSMGVWDPATLAHGMVVLARDADGVLQGFITLHVNLGEATLDLMRSTPDAPDGMNYVLVHAAIEKAHDLGVARFSMAAVPMSAREGEAKLFGHLRALLDAATGAGGLRQFKASFGPNWETLYMAAPTRAALLFGAIDVAREILASPGSKAP